MLENVRKIQYSLEAKREKPSAALNIPKTGGKVHVLNIGY